MGTRARGALWSRGAEAGPRLLEARLSCRVRSVPFGPRGGRLVSLERRRRRGRDHGRSSGSARSPRLRSSPSPRPPGRSPGGCSIPSALPPPPAAGPLSTPFRELLILSFVSRRNPEGTQGRPWSFISNGWWPTGPDPIVTHGTPVCSVPPRPRAVAVPCSLPGVPCSLPGLRVLTTAALPTWLSRASRVRGQVT